MHTALMKQRLPSLSALRVFESAARTQSFKDTANELPVTPTAVNHQTRILETDLDCHLFLQKTRAVSLTSEGQLLYDAVRIGFDAIAAGVENYAQKRAQPSRFQPPPLLPPSGWYRAWRNFKSRIRTLTCTCTPLINL
jgi:DNA-binding transcriptional LysR family regulator